MTLLLDWVIQGIAIATIATIAIRFVPAASASKRHVLWWLALASVLVLPCAPDVFTPSAAMSEAAAPQLGASAATPLTIPAPSLRVVVLVAALCLLMVLISLVRLAVNLRAIRRLAATARPLPAAHEARFEQYAAARRASRAARLFISDEVRGACAVGFIRPRILLSSNLVAMLDDDAIEAIVLHEYAHLQRFDDWTCLVQRVVLAVAGLHPAVRWISRQIDIEREAACDRQVVTRTGAPVAYARFLAAAAEIAARMGGLTPVAAPGASMSGAGLHARVARLLSGTVVSRRRAWAASLTSAATLVLAVAAASGMRPLVEVVSIEQPMLALASMPLRLGAVRELPVARAQVLAGGADVSRTIVARGQVEADTAREPVALDRERPQAADTTQDGEVPAAVTPQQPQQDPPLLSAPMAVTLAIPAAASVEPAREAGAGARAARMGAAAGDKAARAGSSIGRLFKNGGLAIARRF